MRPNLAFVSTFVLGALLIASATVPSVFSQGIPYYVFGFVLDENGDPVENATLEAFLGETILGNTTSDHTGHYLLFLDTSAIPSGGEFFVKASAMDRTSTTATTLVPSVPGQWLNITLGPDKVAPQCLSCDSSFSFWMLAIAAGSIGVALLLLFFIMPKKKKREDDEEGEVGSEVHAGANGEKEELGGR